MLPDCGNLYKSLQKCAHDPKTGKDFFCLVPVLTYGRPWNFITGPRSAGKTTGLACFLLLDFLYNGRQFLYLRRTKDELDITKSKFFNDAIRVIREKCGIAIKEISMQGFDYYITIGDSLPTMCGTSFYLSKEEKLKSGGYFIYNIVYDEFISQDSTGYLGTLEAPREYEKAIELYASMDRGVGQPYRNEVRFFFLGNTATIYNPIFTELNVVKYIHETSKIIAPKNEAWLLQQLGLDDVRILEDYKDSFLYKLSTDEQKDYNFHNKGRDNDSFIEKKPDNAKCFLTLKLQNKAYGVYIADSIFYIAKAQFSTPSTVYSLDVQSHDGIIDREYIHSYGSNTQMRMLVDAYKQGKLRFADGTIKNLFMKYFRFLPN